MSNLLQSIGEFSRKSKTIRIARPEDIISEVPTYSDAQLLKPLAERGKPERVRLEIREGAETQDIQIRPLTMKQREIADRFVDAAIPPQLFVEEIPQRPGDLGKKVPSGYDYENPEYQNALRPLQEKQAAFVVLKGVVGLDESVTGDTDEKKIEQVMESMSAKLVTFLAAEIWGMTYAQGDPVDFFTKGGSSSSPSSGPSPSKNPEE